MRWIALQLADSAFPTGGFAHSQGLESWLRAGLLSHDDSLLHVLEEIVFQCVRGALPYVSSVVRGSATFAQADAHCGSFMVQPVASRASRLQGRALLEACGRAFGDPFVQLRADSRGMATHHAPAFGAVSALLKLAVDEACGVFLHGQLRAALSASVRLGIVGPGEAQRLHTALHPTLDRALEEAVTLELTDVAQTSVLLEIVQAGHDGLYSRLFQS